MKSFIINILLVLAISYSAYAVPKNPRIMVIPADNWCHEHGFWKTYENLGETKGIPNYEQAIQESRELLIVISKINNLMADRGFPLADLAQSIKINNRRSARNSLTLSKSSGYSLAATPLDELNRQAKADIYLEIDFDINNIGPKRSITYNLRALDAYTGKQIAGDEGTGIPTYSSEIPVLLEEAVVGHMDNFISRLQSHFDDCIENGREIVLELGIFDDGSGIDFETEFSGSELREIIERWIATNAVKGKYLTTEKTESILLFEDVRIPLLNEDGSAQDASGFANELRKFLQYNYGLKAKNNSPSLGYAQIILGDK